MYIVKSIQVALSITAENVSEGPGPVLPSLFIYIYFVHLCFALLSSRPTMPL